MPVLGGEGKRWEEQGHTLILEMWRNCINSGDLKYLRLELGKDTASFIDVCEMKSDFNSLFFRFFLSA